VQPSLMPAAPTPIATPMRVEPIQPAPAPRRLPQPRRRWISRP
jgi:hypothetical protein